VFAGDRGPVRDAVLVNAAAALAAYAGIGDDLAGALRDGLARAEQSIDSGAAAETLRRWVELAQSMRA
jgi:anthranilate phosphoribosyltransferase